jgi:hypothetical protein
MVHWDLAAEEFYLKTEYILLLFLLFLMVKISYFISKKVDRILFLGIGCLGYYLHDRELEERKRLASLLRELNI